MSIINISLYDLTRHFIFLSIGKWKMKIGTIVRSIIFDERVICKWNYRERPSVKINFLSNVIVFSPWQHQNLFTVPLTTIVRFHKIKKPLTSMYEDIMQRLSSIQAHDPSIWFCRTSKWKEVMTACPRSSINAWNVSTTLRITQEHIWERCTTTFQSMTFRVEERFINAVVVLKEE